MGVGCQMCTPRAVCRLQKKKEEYKRNETAAAAMENKEVEKHFPFFFSAGWQNLKEKEGNI